MRSEESGRNEEEKNQGFRSWEMREERIEGREKRIRGKKGR